MTSSQGLRLTFVSTGEVDYQLSQIFLKKANFFQIACTAARVLPGPAPAHPHGAGKSLGHVLQRRDARRLPTPRPAAPEAVAVAARGGRRHRSGRDGHTVRSAKVAKIPPQIHPKPTFGLRK